MGSNRLKTILSSVAGLNARVIVGLLIIPTVSVMSGCSGTSGGLSMFQSSSKPTNVADEPPEKLYGEAEALLSSGKYEDGAKKFEEVDRIHPYSKYARRAIVMSAYAYYKQQDYPKAIIGAARYIKLHPGTKESAMAYNIIASSHFDQVKDPKRDQARSKKALRALKTLVQRYPNSRYAAKSRNRIRIVSDVLAASEMSVGRYYLRRSNYLAAINRFKVVVKDYQTTRQVEEALYRLTEGYLALGVGNEAQAAAAVLGHNFPRSKWYKDAYAVLQKNNLLPKVSEGSWITKAWSTSVQSG